VVDEFISSAEQKWAQQSSVVLLLPHGYEGQGPDHSSARIERFLTMCAEDAFVVAQPSTPASYFHLLRQHSLGEEHRPLVVFTPKSMLKRKEAASQPSDFVEGSFRPLIGDATEDVDAVETLLFCSGRVTWDLMVERGKRDEGKQFAVARVEQLYPQPYEQILAEIKRYPNLRTVRWVQDEPANMGPWPHYQLNVWPDVLDETGIKVERVSRAASAAPSVGVAKRHQAEQKDLVAHAFASSSAADARTDDY
jgi:2-oxoglutarate decarboxylase